MKRIAICLAALLVLAAVLAPTVNAEGSGHVLINQVYGASNDGYADHSFIELYNPTDEDVDLSGWSVQYRSSADGDHADAWEVLTLNGTIAANGYYLIRCGAVTSPSGSFTVPQGNTEWDMVLHNKGLSVALLKNSEPLTDAFAGDITAEGFVLPDGFVDLAAAQGNDKTQDQAPPAYEGAYAGIQSKKKAVRRVNFADTDNNAADFEEVNYSKSVPAEKQPHVGAAIPTPPQPSDPPQPTYTPVETGDRQYTGFFNDTSSVRAKLIARYNAGAFNADGGSAEITMYNPANGFAYSVNGVKGTLEGIDMRALTNDASVGKLSAVELKASDLAAGLDETFAYGDMTSVAISPDGTKLAVAMQDEDYTKPGRVLLFACNADGTLHCVGVAATGVQPDMVTFSADGTKILTADEGEPRQGYSAAARWIPKAA